MRVIKWILKWLLLSLLFGLLVGFLGWIGLVIFLIIAFFIPDGKKSKDETPEDKQQRLP